MTLPMLSANVGMILSPTMLKCMSQGMFGTAQLLALCICTCTCAHANDRAANHAKKDPVPLWAVVAEQAHKARACDLHHPW